MVWNMHARMGTESILEESLEVVTDDQWFSCSGRQQNNQEAYSRPDRARKAVAVSRRVLEQGESK